MNNQDHSPSRGIKDADFIRKVLIVLGLALFALLLWQLADVILLAFGAILIAIILSASAEALVRYLHVPKRYSLLLASLIILAIFIGSGILFGTQIRTQFANVVEQLPSALSDFTKNLGLGAIRGDVSEILDSLPASGLAARLAGIGGTILGGLTNLILVVIAGIYIAASPHVYTKGFVQLFPPHYHERVESSLAASGEALKLWLVAQLISMACVGVLSALAFWFLGLPSPHALGLIAGILDFIPFLGPFLGATPAVLIAFSISAETALWTILAVLIVQQIESNVIFPLVARSVVTIPPALALFAILASSLLFGAPGLLFGFPLTIVTYVLVKKLYVRETLGEETTVPGEDKAAPPEGGGSAHD